MLLSLCKYTAALAALVSTAHATPQAGTFTSATVKSPVSTSVAAPTPSSTIACNNSPDLCGRSYANVTHLGAHDSSFLRDASTQNSIAGNQFYNATIALDAGIRLLQVQVHDLNGTAEMCHTLCSLLDAGPLQNWLSDVRFWMDSNPNEVVTLLIVNSDGKQTAEFGSIFEASGISKYGFTPSGKGWPTLGSMIKANTRLVTFIASITPSPSFPYLLTEFDHVFETAFGVTSQTGFNCSIDRPSSPATSTLALKQGLLPLLNHFLDKDLGSSITIPDVENIATTNSPAVGTIGTLGQHLQTCLNEFGQVPTFVLVDFWDEGPAIHAADAINNIANPVGRKNDTATSSSDSNNPNQAERGRGAASMGTGALVAFFVAVLSLA